MTQKDELKRLWSDSFGDSPEYVDMFFSRVYRDSDLIAAEQNGHTLSYLLLQPYSFMFHGAILPTGYICGANTRRNQRGKGLMSKLMTDALRSCASRGYMMAELIPAYDWLYPYYNRFGFSTVFYIDAQRFTSAHQFGPWEDGFKPVENIFDLAVSEAFIRMEKMRPCTILHSSRDFLNTLDDIALSPGGKYVAVSRDSGEVVAMAWAESNPDDPTAPVTVKELLSTDIPAGRAALRELRYHWPDKSFKLLAPAGIHPHFITPRGMCRLTDVGVALSAVAAAQPSFKSTIRVSDPLIPQNNATYRIADGEIDISAYATNSRLDFDVDVSTLADIMFSSPAMGNIIGFPSVRPHISLMLD